jgi:uncharacterized protein (DUF305 family)
MTALPLRGARMLALVLFATACAATARRGDSSSGDPRPLTNAEIEAIYHARIDSARARFTEADVRFMTDMIAHHAQALVMSRLAQTSQAGPPVQLLAARIISAQEDEIARMQQWLRDRSQPVPEVHVAGTTLMIHGVDQHHMHMPGMITDDQLSELAQARGSEFDRLFLTFMIQHHQGAVHMVRELFATEGAGQENEVFKFASDVQVDQTTEVARMELMLSELSASQGSP